MSEKTYATYEMFDGCKPPNNLEYNNRLIGVIRHTDIAPKVDRDMLVHLSGLIDDMGEQYSRKGRHDVGITLHAVSERIKEACGVQS